MLKTKINNSNKGQALLTVVIFFLFISLSVVFALSFPALAELSASNSLLNSRMSYFLAESGAEDLAYRIKTGKNYNSTENLQINNFTASTSVYDLSGDEKQIVSSGNEFNFIRKVKINLNTSDAVSFHYGVQVGDGGLVMENNSTVSGNVYSNGAILGQNSNLIKGDTVSAGPSGSISGITSTSSAYAHNISGSTIQKDAFYTNISGTTVNGSLYPGSPDQPTSTLPISDDLINEWENAATGTVINSPCPYTINSNTTLGNTKITCDLRIKSGAVVTLTGPVWVLGNIDVENNSIIKLDALLGKKSVAFIADNPLNRITSSKISFENSATFQNSGTKGSYILAVSQNNSAELGGGEKAIEVTNSVSGDLLAYSGHGEILLKNSVSLREVTAYRIRISNTANVIYETGLANLLFKSGPSGGFKINGWQETN